jgi:hypothetical protein
MGMQGEAQDHSGASTIMVDAYVNSVDKSGMTPLAYATQAGHVTCTELILSFGGDPLLCPRDALAECYPTQAQEQERKALDLHTTLTDPEVLLLGEKRGGRWLSGVLDAWTEAVGKKKQTAKAKDGDCPVGAHICAIAPTTCDHCFVLL